MSIVFRYLASHWYESLRDACFLASPPNKFNDFFDCASGTEGDVPEEEIKRYFSERDGFGVFMRIAQREGVSLDLVAQVLNSPKFNINSLDLDNRIRLLLASRASFSKIYRIVCFSALPNNPIERIANERRMWKRYADKDNASSID